MNLRILFAVFLFAFIFVFHSTVSADISTGLIGQWKFTEGSGTAVADASGNGNNGTLVNGPTWTQGPAIGKSSSRALYFDGVNDKVTLTTLNSLDNAPAFTISAWVKRATSTKTMGIMHQNGSNNSNFELTYLANGKYQFRVYADTSPIITTKTMYYSVGEWEHVVGVYDGSKLTLSVNGSPSLSVPLVGLMDNNPTSIAEIGKGVVYPGQFEGTIGEIRLYNRALTESDITELYDLYAPSISAVSYTAHANGARISWNTNEPSDSQVAYGQSTTYSHHTNLDSTLTKSHVVYLNNLSSDTTYNFQVRTADIVGNYATSTNISFTTPATLDEVAPVLSSVSSVVTATGATIMWTTNEVADSQVNYGTTQEYTASTSLSTSALQTTHTATITGLTPNTTYHYRVRSADATGNVSISDGFTFTTESTPGSTITLTSPKSYRVFQRNQNNQATIAISGTYTGNPTAIEASWNGNPFVIIDNSPSGGTFSGNLSNMTAGQGDLNVRITNNIAATDATTTIGIGDVYVVAGQSNAVGIGFIPQKYSHQTLKASMFGNDDNWKELVDPLDSPVNQVDSAHSDFAAAGSGWPILASRIMEDQGVPVAFIPAARDASRINQWARSLATTTLYGSMYRRINAIGPVKAILWFQGESDAVDSTTRATYLSKLTALANNVNSDFGVKLVVGQTGYLNYSPVSRVDNIRLAQQDAWNAGGNVLVGPAFLDVNLVQVAGDGVHFKHNNVLKTFADRWWASVKYNFYDGADGRGPRVIAADFASSSNQIVVTFDDENLPLQQTTVNLAGFTASSTGTGPIPVISAQKTADNRVTLTLASSTVGSTTISIGSGISGVSSTAAMVTDNSFFRLQAQIAVNYPVGGIAGTSTGTSTATTTDPGPLRSQSISLITDETATCRYAPTSSLAFSAMSLFATTGGLIHVHPISGLVNGTYTYYAKCVDSTGNTNPDDYHIWFKVGN